MSPASGDRVVNTVVEETVEVSIQLMSPASGDKIVAEPQIIVEERVSIQLMSPASGDAAGLLPNQAPALGFPFN